MHESASPKQQKRTIALAPSDPILPIYIHSTADKKIVAMNDRR